MQIYMHALMHIYIHEKQERGQLTFTYFFFTICVLTSVYMYVCVCKKCLHTHTHMHACLDAYIHTYTKNRKEGRLFLLYASSPEEREDWLHALEVR